MMEQQNGMPVAQMEIYKKKTAIYTLKLCGDYFGENQLIIEVNEENEDYYWGGRNHYYEEFEDRDQDRYTKYDSYPLDYEPASKPSGHGTEATDIKDTTGEGENTETQEQTATPAEDS